jgi:hypothetical protein
MNRMLWQFAASTASSSNQNPEPVRDSLSPASLQVCLNAVQEQLTIVILTDMHSSKLLLTPVNFAAWAAAATPGSVAAARHTSQRILPHECLQQYTLMARSLSSSLL